MTKLDDLTIGEAKQLAALFSNTSVATTSTPTLQFALGEKVIIRTYSADVFFGVLSEKSGNEVILKNARRMWQWHAKKSISLSGVAEFGINADKSRIASAVDNIWLEAIEIIPCTKEAIKTIERAEDAKAQ